MTKNSYQRGPALTGNTSEGNKSRGVYPQIYPQLKPWAQNLMYTEKIKQRQVLTTKMVTVRGRRKSSQKLAKRRTFVWRGGGGRGSRPFSQSKLQKKKKKKKKLHIATFAPLRWALQQIDLRSIEWRRAYVAKGCGEQVHRMRTKKSR